jgi:hypothetical protein
MGIVKAIDWLRERAEDAWALLHPGLDVKPPKKDPRNGL